MAKRSQNKENNETKLKRQNPGMEFMDELEDIKGNILECMLYIAEQFKCKARIDYDEELRKDDEFCQLDTSAKRDNHIPTAYKKENNDQYKRITFTTELFNIDEWKIQKYDEKVVKQYLNLADKASDYMDDAKISLGQNRITTFGNSGLTGPDGDWLFWSDGNSKETSGDHPYGKDSWVGYWGKDGYHWFKVFFSIALAMYVCSGGIKCVWKKRGEGVKDVPTKLIDTIKGKTTELIKKMGIKEPAELFFSDAEMYMCLLLTAFCIKDDMADKEKERIIKALIDHVEGEGTVNYKYREKLLKDVAKKNELLAAADTIISDYYVLPTLSKIKLKDDGRVRCMVDAPIGYGKTTFYRAIVTLMLRNHIIDERITTEKNKLDELEKKIRESWADIEFQNYFPIYINSLTINRRTEVKDLMQLAVGSEYDELIRQYAESDEGRRVMLIIDGLDEVNDFEQRQRLSELIDAFIGEYQNINYIVSTRPIDLAAYENEYDAGAFLKKIQQRVTIKELSKEQKEEIIDKWVRVLSDEVDVDKRLERIRSTIDESHYFSDLSGNPSLLAVTVQKLTVDKPPKQNEIISSIVDYLIKKKMHSRLQGQLKIPDKDIRRVLSCLAYNCITKDINAFDWAKLSTLYINAYQSVSDKIELTQKDKNVWSDSLLEINTKVGLIVFDEETQKYHWQSETLELFLAAEWALLGFQYLVDNNGENDAGTKIREQLDELRKHTRWEDIFIMMLVGWDEIYERSIFRSVIKIIIRYLLDLTITLDKKLIISIGRIILICCLESYANSYDDIVYDKDDTDKEKEKESILLMLRFINQNAKIIDVNGERVEECNNRAKYRVFYDELCEKGLIQFLQQSV